MGSAVSKTLYRKDKVDNMIKKVIRGICHIVMLPLYFVYAPILLIKGIEEYAFDGDMPDFMRFIFCVALELTWLIFLAYLVLASPIFG